VDVELISGRQWPEDVERLLRGLPEWFGIEQALLDYVEHARVLPTTVARERGEVVGACVVRRHNPQAAEIDLLAVHRERHREGIGRLLVEQAAAVLAGDGVKLLQVKTFGPSGDSAEYERTRAFYEAVGFIPLEELRQLWGPENPCLILVMPLEAAPPEPARGGSDAPSTRRSPC
jgi:GNAT superfamily N-acetyltransferase